MKASLPPPSHELPLLLALRVLVVFVFGHDGRVRLEHGRQAVLRERDVLLRVCAIKIIKGMSRVMSLESIP